jgi:hypothetical protein
MRLAIWMKSLTRMKNSSEASVDSCGSFTGRSCGLAEHVDLLFEHAPVQVGHVGHEILAAEDLVVACCT